MKTSRPCLGCVLAVLIGVVLMGCQSSPSQTTSPSDDPRDSKADRNDRDSTPDYESANRATAERLDTKISINQDGLTLEQAIEFVRDTTAVNIAVNWPALELVGIDQETAVSVSLTNASAQTLLQLVLQQASSDVYDNDRAGYAIRQGVVTISTLRDLKQDTVTRVYSMDWYANNGPTRNQRIYGRNDSARRMLGMTTLKNTTIDPNTVGVQNLKPGFCANCDSSHDRLEVAISVMTYHEKIDQIVELISTTVGDPDVWLDEESTLIEINGSLIVKTTHENHSQILQLFESLRQSDARKFKQQALDIETSLLLEAAEASRLKQEYNTALKKINQALRVDPDNLEAKVLKEIVSATLSR